MTSMTSLSTRRFLNGWGTIFISDEGLISNRTQCEKLRTISYVVADLPQPSLQLNSEFTVLLMEL